jgi:hypothetical protein
MNAVPVIRHYQSGANFGQKKNAENIGEMTGHFALTVLK